MWPESNRKQCAGGNEQLLLSGTKSHITNAPIADFFVIVAQYPTERHPKNISLFLVESK